MLIDSEERALIARDEVKSSGGIESSIEKLKKLSRVAIDLEQMGHRSYVAIELFWRGEFSSDINPSVLQAIIVGDCSMFDIIAQPDMKEGFEAQASYEDSYEEDLALCNRLLPTSAYEVMKLTQKQQDDLELLQWAEKGRRYHDAKSLQKAYLKAGGGGSFKGRYEWGLIDHNATNFYIDNYAKSVLFLVRFSTILPHVRYECRLTSSFDGIALIKQSLKVDPRVGFITEGIDEWYKRVRLQDVPSQ